MREPNECDIKSLGTSYSSEEIITILEKEDTESEMATGQDLYKVSV